MGSNKICIVLSPVAGHGKAANLLPKVLEILKSGGIVPCVMHSRYPGHPTELAKEACMKGYDMVVAMGGDGTVGEVVNGIMDAGSAKAALGIIPAGTGNDFVAGNRLFSDWKHATEALLEPFVKQLDVISFQDSGGIKKYAINSIGVGYDAYVVKQVAALGSRKFGRLGYMLEALKGIIKFEPETLRLGIKDEKSKTDKVVTSISGSCPMLEKKKVWLFAITNSENFGGGMKVCPGANSWDGRFDYAFLEGMPRYKLLRLVFLVRSGNHIGKPGVFRGQATEIIIGAPQGFPCHVDGDVVDASYPILVRLHAGVLSAVVGQRRVFEEGKSAI